MTDDLLSFSEVDAYLTEHDGGCVHDPKGNYHFKEPYYICKKCGELRETAALIDNPIARDLGKLVDLLRDKRIMARMFYGDNSVQVTIPLKCKPESGTIEMSVDYKDYDSSQLAGAAVLGNGIVRVLKEK